MKIPYEEVDQIIAAIRKLQERSTAPQMKYANLSAASEAIMSAWSYEYLYVEGDYAVIAYPGTIWYSRELFLMEQLVVKFRNECGNSVDSVPLLLEQVAKDQGCVAIITGDAQRGLMEPVYTRAGFAPVGRQFIKDV